MFQVFAREQHASYMLLTDPLGDANGNSHWDDRRNGLYAISKHTGNFGPSDSIFR